jgi:putative intracellular protease/amidase
MAKKVLAVLSGHEYWGEELIGPFEAVEAAGDETEFVTPKGTKPVTRVRMVEKL